MDCLRFVLLLAVLPLAFTWSTSESAIILWNKLVGRKVSMGTTQQPALPRLKYRGIERQACTSKACELRYGTDSK